MHSDINLKSRWASTNSAWPFSSPKYTKAKWDSALLGFPCPRWLFPIHPWPPAREIDRPFGSCCHWMSSAGVGWVGTRDGNGSLSHILSLLHVPQELVRAFIQSMPVTPTGLAATTALGRYPAEIQPYLRNSYLKCGLQTVNAAQVEDGWSH